MQCTVHDANWFSLLTLGAPRGVDTQHYTDALNPRSSSTLSFQMWSQTWRLRTSHPSGRVLRSTCSRSNSFEVRNRLLQSDPSEGGLWRSPKISNCARTAATSTQSREWASWARRLYIAQLIVVTADSMYASSGIRGYSSNDFSIQSKGKLIFTTPGSTQSALLVL